MKRTREVAVLLGSAMIMLSLAACGGEKGPAEKAGRKVDESVEKAADKIEEAGKKMEEAAEETGEKMKELKEEAGKKLEEAGESMQE